MNNNFLRLLGMLVIRCSERPRYITELFGAMMNKRISILIVIACLMGSSVAHADCDASSCSNVTLTVLYIDDNNAYIQTSGNQSNLSCTQTGTLLTVPGTSPNFKLIYATLLSAKLQNLPVSTIRLNPSITTCTVAYVILR